MRNAISSGMELVSPHPAMARLTPNKEKVRRCLRLNRSLSRPLKGRTHMEAMDSAPTTVPATASDAPNPVTYNDMVVETI